MTKTSAQYTTNLAKRDSKVEEVPPQGQVPAVDSLVSRVVDSRAGVVRLSHLLRVPEDLVVVAAVVSLRLIQTRYLSKSEQSSKP